MRETCIEVSYTPTRSPRQIDANFIYKKSKTPSSASKGNGFVNRIKVWMEMISQGFYYEPQGLYFEGQGLY